MDFCPYGGHGTVVLTQKKCGNHEIFHLWDFQQFHENLKLYGIIINFYGILSCIEYHH